MSKYVKNLITDHLRKELGSVRDAFLINVQPLDANRAFKLRKRFREKNIRLLVIKNSLARRATEGLPIASAFIGLEGSTAVCWGAEDFVSLAKEVVSVLDEKQFNVIVNRGGVVEGSRIGPEEVRNVAKWPNRGEQLSLLVGQILSVGRTLAGQITAPAGAVASQIEKKAESAPGEPAAAEPAAEAAPAS
jgi:ribosomal protein L10